MKTILENKEQSQMVPQQTKDNSEFDKILSIQTVCLKAIQDFLYFKGLVQMMPVIISPITDPLNHSVHNAKIEYEDQVLQLTKSMIFHKQISIATIEADGLFIFSPNVRLEKKNSNKHLLEFTQVDIELKKSSRRDFMDLIEELIQYVFQEVKSKCATELRYFGTELPIPLRPFKVYTTSELIDKYGPFYESEASKREKHPFWILDHNREFYDKEDPLNPGHFLNYDLIYPLGFGEALSGGERDYKYDILLRKIREKQMNPQDFEYYLKKALENKLIPSAGGGLGIERLIRFLTQKTQISEVRLFSRIPGKKILI